MDIYKHIDWKSGNTLTTISPLSIKLFARMILGGVHNQTHLKNIIGDEDMDAISFDRIKSVFGAWTNKNVFFTEAFKKSAREFDNNMIIGEETIDATTIQNLIKKVTEGELDVNVDVNSDTYAYLMHAMLVSEQWYLPFETTRKHLFYVEPRQIEYYDMFYKKDSYKIMSGEDYVCLLLKTKSNVEMHLVLPNEWMDSPAPEFVDRVSQLDFTDTDYQTVELLLPRLMETNEHTINQLLLGEGNDKVELFDILTRQRDSTDDVDCKQVCRLDMDAEGFKVAALTTSTLERSGEPMGPPPSKFICERPFLVICRDPTMKTPISITFVKRPSENAVVQQKTDNFMTSAGQEVINYIKNFQHYRKPIPAKKDFSTLKNDYQYTCEEPIPKLEPLNFRNNTQQNRTNSYSNMKKYGRKWVRKDPKDNN